MVPGIDKRNDTYNEVGAMLPQMAAMFFDGLTPNIDDVNSVERPKISLRSDLHSKIQFLRLPPVGKERRKRPINRESVFTAKDAGMAVYRREDQFTMLRAFVLNLSHTYNNILMGILGNVTLINMDFKDQPEQQETIRQMEQMIQTGGNLINLIFGYLVERRLPAKRLQLIQLFSEFELCRQSQYQGIDIDGFKNNMQQIAADNNHSEIIAAVARVMEQLLSWVKDERASLKRMKPGCSRTQSRLAVLDKLLGHGFKIVQDLKYHTNEVKPKIRRMSLRVLIQKHVRQLKQDNTRIIILDDLPRRWPWIFADRRHIEYALRQIIDNAIQAMPVKGNLTIRVRTLTDEKPSERCAVHAGGDYVVVTIADSGNGMDINTQARIFQPFFKMKTNGARHVGLGLSAASGIVKAHGGYIQVRSATGCGTRIKIYLPFE